MILEQFVAEALLDPRNLIGETSQARAGRESMDLEGAELDEVPRMVSRPRATWQRAISLRNASKTARFGCRSRAQARVSPASMAL